MRVPSPPPSDAELLADSADPAESFTLFYRRHYEAVVSFVASQGADPDTAADVVAETFAAALAQRYRYEPERDTARLWLLTIAIRRLADARRREAREQRRIARAGEFARLSDRDRESYAAFIAHLEAMDALDGLPDSERALIVARVIQDRSYAEIAEALGLTETTTRKRVSRGLAQLRTRLGRPRE